jgi:hypothetical protein
MIPRRLRSSRHAQGEDVRAGQAERSGRAFVGKDYGKGWDAPEL